METEKRKSKEELTKLNEIEDAYNIVFDEEIYVFKPIKYSYPGLNCIELLNYALGMVIHFKQ